MRQYTVAQLQAMRPLELRGLLSALGESTAGNKRTLIQRFIDLQHQDTDPSPASLALHSTAGSDSPVYSESESEPEEDEFLHSREATDMDAKQSQTQSRVIKLISRPSDQRSNPEIDLVLPWLKKKSDVMKSLEDNILKHIVRQCDHLRTGPDELVIRQGDIGDCEMKGGDEGADAGATVTQEDKRLRWQEMAETIISDVKSNKNRTVNRKEFGKKIVNFGAGKAFGEIALLSDDSVRTASIISDETCDLMVVGRKVYNNTLKAFHEREFEERRDFIENCPLFQGWTKKYKKQLERGLIKECYPMDMSIFKQGQSLRGLYFVRRGSGKVLVEPEKHEKQYPQLRPFQTEHDIYELENIKPRKRKRDSRGSSANVAVDKTRDVDAHSAVSHRSAPDALGTAKRAGAGADGGGGGVTGGTSNEHVRIKRKEGYAAAEKHMLNRFIVLCVARDGAMFGDVELIQSLPTFSHSLVTITYTEVYFVSIKNVERLICKRNPATMRLLEESVLDKVCGRAAYVQGGHIPLVNHLAFRMTDDRKPVNRVPLQLTFTTKALPDKFTLFQHLLDEYIHNKAQLLETAVPGSVYYKAVMREKALERARMRHNKVHEKRKQIEEQVRTRLILSRQRSNTGLSDSDDEFTPYRDAGQPAPLPAPSPRLGLLGAGSTNLAFPLARVHSVDVLGDTDTGKQQQQQRSAFMTELSEAVSESKPSARERRQAPTTSTGSKMAVTQEMNVVQKRPEALRHQSATTVCMVYDESAQRTRVTYNGGLHSIGSPLPALPGWDPDSPEPSRCPSDSRMVGAPPHFDSQNPSRKSSSRSRPPPNVEIVCRPNSGYNRNRILPPLNEDKLSQIASQASPRPDTLYSGLNTARNIDTPSLEPSSTVLQNETYKNGSKSARDRQESTYAPTANYESQALNQRQSLQLTGDGGGIPPPLEGHSPPPLSPRASTSKLHTGQIVTDASSHKAHHSETGSVTAQCREKLQLPLIENKPNSRKSEKKTINQQ